MIFPHLALRALELAAMWHEGQMRKHPSEQIPYIAHPAAVGMLLARAEADEETIAAGILHDVIEDCGITPAQLAAATTPRVAELVGWVTEPPKNVAWKTRKQSYRDRLADAPVEALEIAAADHIHNLHSIVTVAQTHKDVWKLFHSDKPTKIAHEREVYALVAQGAPASKLLPLFASVLEEVEQLP